MDTILNTLQAIPWFAHVAILGAAMLQAVTGVGFGLVAGPVLLVAMSSHAAIQVSIILSFITALLLAPQSLPHADRQLLKTLAIGLIIGSPFGVFAYLAMPLPWLKSLTAAALLFMIVLAGGGLNNRFPISYTKHRNRLGTGLVAGTLSASLGMPGPAVAAFMTSAQVNSRVIRASTLTLFLFAYPIAWLVQMMFVGLNAGVTATTVGLLPVTIGGVILGTLASRWVSEKLYRTLTISVLVMTLVALLVSLF